MLLPKMYPVIDPSVWVIFHIEVRVGLQVPYAEPFQSHSLDGSIRGAGANATWHGTLATLSCQVEIRIPIAAMYGNQCIFPFYFFMNEN